MKERFADRRLCIPATIAAALILATTGLAPAIAADPAAPVARTEPAPVMTITVGTSRPVVMNIVAHQDDDTYFQNPDIQDALDAGAEVVTVYITAGNDTYGSDFDDTRYWQDRSAGARAAYETMVDPSGSLQLEWVDDPCTFEEWWVTSRLRYTQTGTYAGVTLIFFSLNAAACCGIETDGGDPWGGPDPRSIGYLWRNPSSRSPVFNTEPQTYTDDDFPGGKALTSFPRERSCRYRQSSSGAVVDGVTAADVVGGLTQLMGEFHPGRVNLLDPSRLRWNTKAGDWDHSDHVYGSYFGLEAVHKYLAKSEPEDTSNTSDSLPFEVVMYRTYNLEADPLAQLNARQRFEKCDAFSAYAARDFRFGAPFNKGGPCDPNAEWLRHRSSVRSLAYLPATVIRNGSGCLVSSQGTAALGTCDTTTRWEVNRDGQIRLDGRCLRADSIAAYDDKAYSVTISECDPSSVAEQWTVFASGQIRSQWGRCLTGTGTGVVVQECSRDYDNYDTTDPSKSISKDVGPQRWLITADEPTLRLADSAGAPRWNQAATSSGSIRFPDVNGDGRADACWRASDGLNCALGTPSGDFATPHLATAYFTDGQGWSPPYYGGTIEFGDIDGDGRSDVCGRASAGMVCALSESRTEARFGAAHHVTAGPLGGEPSPQRYFFGDSSGWAGADYYPTIRLADVNGDGLADVCGRGSNGVVCALNHPQRPGSFGDLQTAAPEMRCPPAAGRCADAASIGFGDLDSDGHADVCARFPDGVRCARSTSVDTTLGFEEPSRRSFLEDFSDGDVHRGLENNETMGWNGGRAYPVRLGDVDGDGRADICGRSVAGVVCALSDGHSFSPAKHLQASAFSDTAGWGAEQYGSTLRLVDIGGDGRVDVCARGTAGIICSPAPGTSDGH